MTCHHGLQWGVQGDVRGADAIAVRDGRQSLNVRTQQPAEDLCLGLAKLGKVGCDVGHRAVVLAHLHAAAGLLGRCRVPFGRQCRRELRRAIVEWDVGEHRLVAGLDGRESAPGELHHRGVAAGLAEVGQRRHRQIVVGVWKSLAAGVGEGEQLGRTAAPADLAPDLPLRHLAYPALGDQRVEVAPDGGGRQAEARAQRDRALWPLLVKRPRDTVAGTRIFVRSHLACLRAIGRLGGFHNDNVTYFEVAHTPRGAPRACRGDARTIGGAMTAPTEPRIAPSATITSPARVTTIWRNWRPSSDMLRRLALAALLANIAIVATGGLVRLTGSGLGCPSWPDCAGSSLVPTRQLSWHKYVEFGNRLFTYVVLVAAVAALVGVLRARPRRATLRPWAWFVFLGVPAQAIMGGITVLTHLNPWAVAAHFVLSMVLVAAATVLWWRTRADAEPSAGDRPVHPLLHQLAWATWAATFAVFVVGTIVTGAGPHAGDPSAPRIHLKPVSIAQLHADLVMLLVGLSIALAVAVRASGASRVVRQTTTALVAVLVFQTAIGFLQYFSKLPIGLVELHLLGAALIAAAATAVVVATGTTPDAARAGV